MVTNTGNLDMNADGRNQRTGNIIRALTLLANGEVMCSHRMSRAAGRSNAFGATRRWEALATESERSTVGYYGRVCRGERQ